MKSDSVALTQRIIMKLSRKPNPINGRPLTTDTAIVESNDLFIDFSFEFNSNLG